MALNLAGKIIRARDRVGALKGQLEEIEKTGLLDWKRSELKDRAVKKAEAELEEEIRAIETDLQVEIQAQQTFCRNRRQGGDPDQMQNREYIATG